MSETATQSDAEFGKRLTLIGLLWTAAIVGAGVALLQFQGAIGGLF